ncbi:hypothetical protein TWF694_003423 [Orbilia ellipsospora]|uniref:Uncharacterized protein n=1 Tax=Orbilia ellipsospora TaxID=2528407 RepID=A0AAV9WY48_9PEZI
MAMSARAPNDLKNKRVRQQMHAILDLKDRYGAWHYYKDVYFGESIKISPQVP